MNDTKRKCVYILESQYVEGRGYVPSLVVEGEAGHSPLVGSGEFSEPWYWGPDLKGAQKLAADYNRRLGLTDKDVTDIVISSMAADGRLATARAEVDRKLGR